MRRWQDEVGVLGREVGVPMAAAVGALTAISVGVGLVVTRVLDAVARYDLDVERDLADGRTPALDDLTGAATILAETVPVSVLWVAAMAFAAWRSRQWTIPVFLLVAIGGEKLTDLFTSLAVGRERPPVEALGHVYATRSFPSGHIGAAITLYGGIVVALLWRRGAPTAAKVGLGVLVAAVAALVGFSRLYRGHHYPTDVAWGAVLGVVWLAFAWRLVLRGR